MVGIVYCGAQFVHVITGQAAKISLALCEKLTALTVWRMTGRRFLFESSFKEVTFTGFIVAATVGRTFTAFDALFGTHQKARVFFAETIRRPFNAAALIVFRSTTITAPNRRCYATCFKSGVVHSSINGQKHNHVQLIFATRPFSPTRRGGEMPETSATPLGV